MIIIITIIIIIVACSHRVIKSCNKPCNNRVIIA